jgi:hypothetical protein
MINWNLSNIIAKVRATTSRPDATMMDDATITDYINKFYQYVLPKELKIFWGYTYYTFFCQANVDQYPAPSTFQTLNPQAWADGWPIDWYLSPQLFYQDYPKQDNKQVVAQGNGVLNSFPFNISAYPVLSRSIYVTDGTQVVTDAPSSPYNGTGSFVNYSTGLPVAGSVNYSSGVVTGLSFPVAPAANTNITCASYTYMPNRPQAIMMYKSQPLINATEAAVKAVNMFVLRPVPDQVYEIKMQGIQIPAELVNMSDVPFRTDLGPLIAYGASLEIFSDFNQQDLYDQTLTQYNRYKDVSMQDTFEEYLYQRSVPVF